jgi:hypothetical protein
LFLDSQTLSILPVVRYLGFSASPRKLHIDSRKPDEADDEAPNARSSLNPIGGQSTIPSMNSRRSVPAGQIRQRSTVTYSKVALPMVEVTATKQP